MNTETILLLAKMSRFFAQCDNDYNITEQHFVKGFLSGVESQLSGDPALARSVADALQDSYTLDDIIDHSRRLVDSTPPEQRHSLLDTIDRFIDRVVLLDARLQSPEILNYGLWREQMGLA